MAIRSGDSATEEGERYYALLSTQVRRYYSASDTIPEAERSSLKASVMLKLSREGNVLELAMVSPSGNTIFDSAVLATIKKASPFSPPPAHLRGVLQSEGVILDFSP